MEYFASENSIFLLAVNIDFVRIDDIDLELGEKIGHGGFGAVYRAEWLSRDDTVAVKKLHPTCLDEDGERTFFKELLFLNRIRYPHIISFYGACVEKEKYALVMEYMPLGSLYKILHNENVEITWPERLSIALQAAKGVNYLHRYNRQILHRDIKSRNFLLDRNNEGYLVKICDFGLAKTQGETRRQSKDDTAVAITLPWTAPEILRFEEYTDKSDIYSLGIVFWELATNKKPYDNCADDVVSRSVRDGQRLPLTEIQPSNFHTVIQKCWAHNRDNRPDTSRLMEMINDCIQRQSN